MTSQRERELKAQIKRLKKQLQENEKLMLQTALRIESMEGASQSLNGSLEASKAARLRRTKSNNRAAI